MITKTRRIQVNIQPRIKINENEDRSKIHNHLTAIPFHSRRRFKSFQYLTVKHVYTCTIDKRSVIRIRIISFT